MKPKVVHQEAMDFSFKAKQALVQGNYTSAFEFYKQAATLESKVAEFYFDKPELEPTRSVIIRSAAFLNIKAGLIEDAKKFIFFGLLNTSDKLIKLQLTNALELVVSLGSLPPEAASGEFNYFNLLRQRSVHYILEPSTHIYGNSVSLEMLKDFSDSYLKSLKAFAISKFKRILELENEIEEAITKEIERLINPLITSSNIGSFKFSIANDFYKRDGEKKEVSELKANIISKYHNEIFINPLSDNDIDTIRKNFSDEEVNQIFRPLSKIKAQNAAYTVSYYDSEDFNKKPVSRLVSKQRQKLLTVKQVTEEDIGELESTITHKRNTEGGKVHKTTIFKEQMKYAEYTYKTNQIDPSDNPPLILNEEIILDLNFNSNVGFTFSYSDLNVESTDIDYRKALKNFYNSFYEKLKFLANTETKNEDELRDWELAKKLIGNPGALKK